MLFNSTFNNISIASVDRHVRDRMVVGTTTIYVISTYHHRCELDSRLGDTTVCGEVCQ
jgi:hypothetical protein